MKKMLVMLLLFVSPVLLMAQGIGFTPAEPQPLYTTQTVQVDTSKLYYCSYDSADVASLNQAINDSLSVKVKGYSASQYSQVFKHPERPEWAIGIEKNDLRDPLRFLTETREAMLVERSEMIKQRWFSL